VPAPISDSTQARESTSSSPTRRSSSGMVRMSRGLTSSAPLIARSMRLP
jgi:hypothetical protein